MLYKTCLKYLKTGREIFPDWCQPDEVCPRVSIISIALDINTLPLHQPEDPLPRHEYNQPERIGSKSNRTKLIGSQDRCDVEFQVGRYFKFILIKVGADFEFYTRKATLLNCYDWSTLSKVEWPCQYWVKLGKYHISISFSCDKSLQGLEILWWRLWGSFVCIYLSWRQ